MKPLVSIVVNNYNYARYLRRAIDSALDQTYARTEVIVVDDGSTDGSRETIAGYGDRIVPVLKENGGQASAFNAGFEASRGEVVVFLDADDYLFPQAVERVVAAWEPGAANVQYRLEMVDALEKPIGVRPERGVRMESGNEVWRVLLEKGSRVHPPTSGNAFSRGALEKVLPMPEADWRISADGYLLTLAPFCGKVVSIEEPLGAYRVHGDNLWINLDIKSNRDLLARVRYDVRKQRLMTRYAAELGYSVPKDLGSRNHRAIQYRMASLRLNPQEHPVTDDGRTSLLYRGVKSVWRYSELPWKKRVTLSVWFIAAGLLPGAAARPIIAWGLTPKSRPKAVRWVRNSVAPRVATEAEGAE